MPHLSRRYRIVIVCAMFFAHSSAAQAPKIESVSPASGISLGGTLITIVGTNLQPVDSVTIGNSEVDNLLIVDEKTLTGNTPPGTAGINDVIVSASTGSATLAAGFQYLDGKPVQGAALSFDGLDDRVIFGRVKRLSQHTIEAWVMQDGTGERTQFIVGHLNGPDVGPCGLGMALTNRRGQIGYFVDPASCGGGPEAVDPQSSAGKWIHIAGTWDGVISRLYIDGTLITEVAGSFSPASWMTAGGTQFNNQFSGFYKGMLDELRIWNVTRTVQQLQDTMFKPLRGNEPGLVGYWDFNEGSGQTVSDLSRSGTNGILGTSEGVQASDPTWVKSDALIQEVDYEIFLDGFENSN